MIPTGNASYISTQAPPILGAIYHFFCRGYFLHLHTYLLVDSLGFSNTQKRVRVGAISASGASTPDDLNTLLMAKVEQKGACGYRIASVSNMSPYSGTATLYR